jgi:hypothetical protein
MTPLLTSPSAAPPGQAGAGTVAPPTWSAQHVAKAHCDVARAVAAPRFDQVQGLSDAFCEALGGANHIGRVNRLVSRDRYHGPLAMGLDKVW